MRLKTRLLSFGVMAAVATAVLPGAAMAADAEVGTETLVHLDIPGGPAAAGLNALATQAGLQLFYPFEAVKGRSISSVKGDFTRDQAIQQMASAAGLRVERIDGQTVTLAPQSGSAAGDGADQGTVQALIVTAQKREENIQDVPIAMSAFTQEDLTRSQVAGGPDLMTQVPNFTFTKTNFTGYSIQIRGIGTQAISATTDAAVAVAFNNTPFIRNRFFEQEFYDLERVEVLRGPQGTLYGRNATAGVVNLISAKPKFTYEAKLSADVGNYNSTRLEGMLNIPLVDDKVALRVAGAWTKRDGYSTNEITGNPIDGRDLWSTRVSLRLEPTDFLHANLIWEHFEEKDDRLRSGKQLCHTDEIKHIAGFDTYHEEVLNEYGQGVLFSGVQGTFSQGCNESSLYSPDSFQTPNGLSLPYFGPLAIVGVPIVGGGLNFIDPYANSGQSHDLRVIESTIDPLYNAETNTVELQFNWDLPKNLTLTSETGYNSDTLFSMEDYNRFATAPGVFVDNIDGTGHFQRNGVLNNGYFCDPQIGCANRLVAMDVSTAKSAQFSQEFRLASNFDGRFNFSLGANFLRYDTEDKYYVFVNTLSMYAAQSPYAPHSGRGSFRDPLSPYVPNVTDNTECLQSGFTPPNVNGTESVAGCVYMDPNPISSLNDLGHNYFLSRNPYKLLSYAVFGEAYYNITDNLKLTAGLRWTYDKKEAPRIPSWVLAADTVGYPVAEVVKQTWREPTGRLALDWKPDLSFTDQTLVYASFAHGYKAGGMNPPAAAIVCPNNCADATAAALLGSSATHPKTFDPEFVNAYELGSKNTLLDGRLTLNGDVFYYDYTGYQISQIVDRSAVNLNFDSKVWGAELEADWRPIENLRLGLKLGYERTRVADNARAVDLMDRTAGNPDWVVVRPFPTFPSNCVLPAWLFVGTDSGTNPALVNVGGRGGGNLGGCEEAYVMGHDPATGAAYAFDPYTTTSIPDGRIFRTNVNYAAWNTDLSHYPCWPTDPSTGEPVPITNSLNYPGVDPQCLAALSNNGTGFYKNLGGNELPNAPHITATLTGDYTVPLPNNWLATFHTDLYYQSEAWTRIFNTPGYDKLKAYSNVNLAAIFSNEDLGWKVMAYVKNVFNRDSITGAFLNSDDTGLTTNVFLTEPRLYGLRVTKEWSGGPWWTGAGANQTGPFPLTVELGGQIQHQDAPYEAVAPDFANKFSATLDPRAPQNRGLDWGDGREVRITYHPASGPWMVTAALQSGRTNNGTTRLHGQEDSGPARCSFLPTGFFGWVCSPLTNPGFSPSVIKTGINWSDSSANDRERHLVAEFAVGRDMGLGLPNGKSIVKTGLRYAHLQSNTDAAMNGIPDWQVPEGWAKYNSSHDYYSTNIHADREFTGTGPELAWEASAPLIGKPDAGHLDVDWSLTGGVLFGKQKTSASGTESAGYFSGKYNSIIQSRPTPSPFAMPTREKSASVPMLDFSLGLSYGVQRVKISSGYRWERYFNAVDAGFQDRKTYDRTFDGPYFKIAVGFGG